MFESNFFEALVNNIGFSWKFGLDCLVNTFILLGVTLFQSSFLASLLVFCCFYSSSFFFVLISCSLFLHQSINGLLFEAPFYITRRIKLVESKQVVASMFSILFPAFQFRIQSSKTSKKVRNQLSVDSFQY